MTSAAAAELAARMTRMADGLETSSRAGMPETLGWSGAAATAAAAALALVPGEYEAAASAAREVAVALRRHAGVAAESERLAERARALERDDPVQARVLAEQARATAAESARRAASAVAGATSRAPRRPPLLARLVRKLVEWQAEVRVGCAESVGAMAGTAVRFNQVRVLTQPLAADADARPIAVGAGVAARDPVTAARQFVDWETWRTNPSRAVGRLLPDLATAGTTRSATVAARTRRIGAQRETAVAVAAGKDRARRSTLEFVALTARHRLVGTALTRGRVHGRPWAGEAGARLEAPDSGAADEFLTLSVRDEEKRTTTMGGIAHRIDGQLAGTDHRMKTADSLKRKLATELSSLGPMRDRLFAVDDALRYTVVLDRDRYTAQVRQAAHQLEVAGFAREKVKNHWEGDRYRGINSVWTDPASGATFELQFHTPASWDATVRTHEKYERMRVLPLGNPLRLQLHEEIAAEFRKAPLPPRVTGISVDTVLPPLTRPVVPAAPADVALVTGAGAGAVVAVAGADRKQP